MEVEQNIPDQAPATREHVGTQGGPETGDMSAAFMRKRDRESGFGMQRGLGGLRRINPDVTVNRGLSNL